MKRIRVAIIIGVLALTAGLPAWAQSDNVVDLDGVTLELGASRADTMDALRPRLRVLPSRTEGYYNLYRNSSGSENGPINSLSIGAIMIHDDRLVSVTRNLGSFQSMDGIAAMDNFIAAVSEASKKLSDGPVYLKPSKHSLPHLPELMAHTDSQQVGNASSSRVYFTFPDRIIQLAVYQPADPNARATVAISEQYSLRERQ